MNFLKNFLLIFALGFATIAFVPSTLSATAGDPTEQELETCGQPLGQPNFYVCEDTNEIPEMESRWEWTNPLSFTTSVLSCNSDAGGKREEGKCAHIPKPDPTATCEVSVKKGKWIWKWVIPQPTDCSEKPWKLKNPKVIRTP